MVSRLMLLAPTLSTPEISTLVIFALSSRLSVNGPYSEFPLPSQFYLPHATTCPRADEILPISLYVLLLLMDAGARTAEVPSPGAHSS